MKELINVEVISRDGKENWETKNATSIKWWKEDKETWVFTIELKDGSEASFHDDDWTYYTK